MSVHHIGMQIEAIPAFRDNYIWALSTGKTCAVVDPGEAPPVQQYLQRHNLKLTAILVTHHHHDHIDGIDALVGEWKVPVYGPRAEHIPHCTHRLADRDRIRLTQFDLDLEILALPGHTLGHIAYYGKGILLCGDTLFSAGCGRLFEGTPEQLHASLKRLAALPADTLVCCTHEYTLRNLEFAQMVEPDNRDVATRLDEVRALRARGRPSLPSNIGLERRTNPFLRTHVTTICRSAQKHAGHMLASDEAVFTVLRRWKDSF